MKLYRACFALLFGIAVPFFLVAQKNMSPIKPIDVTVSDSLTTTLLFPFAIQKASWCSPYFAVQQTKEVGNMLEIKSTIADFTPSNLSVVTSDGHFYSFILSYEKQPSTLNWRFEKGESVSHSGVLLTAMPVDEARMDLFADSVIAAPGFVHRTSRNDVLKLNLRGLYAAAGLTWVSIVITNRTDFEITLERSDILIRNKRKLRKGIAQTRSIKPSYLSKPIILQGRTETAIVVAIPMQQIAKDKTISLSFYDSHGNRASHIALPSTLLRRTKRL